MSLREDYNRDGYALVQGLLRNECINYCGHYVVNLFKKTFDDDVNKYISLLSSMARNVHFQKLFLNRKVENELAYLGLVSNIIISQPVLHVMSPSLRIPDGYYGTAAHQDWPSTQGSLDCVTVWIALTDAGIGNFPLEVIPGSHKQGLLDGKMNGSVLEVDVDEREFVSIECKAGDVIFMSGFTVHRTGEGTGFRVAVSQRFDNAAESTFIERGYPCVQKRVVEREIKWRPKVEQVAKVFS